MKTIKLEVVQTVNDSDKLIIESYWLNGKLHNEHGSAYRRWDDSGQLVQESHWLNDKLHN